MKAEVSRRGAAPVGFISELDPIEAGAVYYLRLWSQGQEGQAQVLTELSQTLGAREGRQVLEAFDSLHRLCVQHARRPLMRHAVCCKCLGADESCFANFIGYASEGAREDALLLAANIVNPQMAPALVGVAERFGRALRCLSTMTHDHIHPPLTLH